MIPKLKYLKLALYNAGSLGTGHDDFLVAMNRFEPDLVAINETWLPAGQEARAPTVPGYRLRSAPRPRHMRGGRGGGVAFYVKRDLRVHFLKHPNAEIEQLWLSVRVNGFSLLIGTAYRPQWINTDLFIDALTETITVFAKYDYTVLLGDFNINMLDNSDTRVYEFNQFLQYLDLQQVVKEPTHFSVGSSTLIDLVCTNCKVRDVAVSNIRGSLGHGMINVGLMIKKTKIPPKCITYRPLKSLDLNQFDIDVLALDWDALSSLPTVEDMVDGFQSLLLSMLDQHAPLITKKVKFTKTLPWITNVIKYMMDLRNVAYDKYRSTQSEVHKKYYKDLKALVTTSIYHEKRAYFDHYINKHIHDGKTFWRNIKEKILPCSDKSDCLPDCYDNPNGINEHFLNVPGDDKVSNTHSSYYEQHRYNTSLPPFKLSPVSELEVSGYIKAIKSNAIGSDGISRDMVLLTLPRTLSIITDIVNRSILTGVVPRQWKHALITPLPKVDHPTDLKDLRPISILPFLSKILEKAVHTQLMKYVELSKILPSHQSGFRRGRGTVTALLDVTDNILADQDCGKGTLLALLDFSRAFDSLNITLLLAKMSYYGFDPHTITWFASYLGERYQSVRLRKEDGSYDVSNPSLLRRGVPQGSILGPLLFIIYSADLANVIRNCRYHSYADDVQLYISGEATEIHATSQALNDDLNAVADWSTNNALTLNPLKSKLIVFGPAKFCEKFNTDDGPAISILGTNIERTTEARNLGVIFDSCLRFESHVLGLIKNCFYRLKVLYKVRNLLSEKARIALCEALVLSRLNYGDLVYGPRLLCRTKRKIQRVQNACARFCFDIPPRTHVTPFLNSASMLNMESRRRLHLASLMFDVIYHKNPEYLYVKLKFSCFHKQYGSGAPRSVRVPLAMHTHKTVGFTGSFRYQATKCWNNIPPPLRAAKSKYTFKTQIKSALLECQRSGGGFGGG